MNSVFEGFVSQLENKSRERDQASFCKYFEYINRLNVEGKRFITSQIIKDEDGNLLQDPTLIRER